jgi:HSP20 family protein
LIVDPYEMLRTLAGEVATGMPLMDVQETDEAYVVGVDMPGVRPDDIDVTLERQSLVIRARYGAEREETAEQQGRWLLRERSSGLFTRSVVLPDAIDAEAVTSSFENGELRLTLPKAKEGRARRIPITGSADAAKKVGGGGDVPKGEEETQQG